MTSQIYLTDNQVAGRYGIKRGSVWRWTKENEDFPKPVRFTKGCVRWSISELESYERKQAEASQRIKL